MGKHNNEKLRSVRKTKKCCAACPLLKWSEKRLVTWLHSADKHASRQFHVISYSLIFHVCMLQNEATVLKQMTCAVTFISRKLFCFVNYILRRQLCHARRGWQQALEGRQNEMTNNTQNTMCPAQHPTTGTQLLQWRSHHKASDVISCHDDMHYNVHTALFRKASASLLAVNNTGNVRIPQPCGAFV